MIRIVGVQRSECVGQEFVLLQNQGSMRTKLRGHAIVSDCAINEGAESAAWHLFDDDIDIHPGQYVLLRTSVGRSHWSTTSEGQRVYYAHMHRTNPIWNKSRGSLHILSTQHTYAERPAEVILV